MGNDVEVLCAITGVGVEAMFESAAEHVVTVVRKQQRFSSAYHIPFQRQADNRLDILLILGSQCVTLVAFNIVLRSSNLQETYPRWRCGSVNHHLDPMIYTLVTIMPESLEQSPLMSHGKIGVHQPAGIHGANTLSSSIGR